MPKTANLTLKFSKEQKKLYICKLKKTPFAEKRVEGVG